MALYQAVFTVAGVNSTTNVLAMLKTAATDRAIIREIGVFIEAVESNAPIFGLARMNAVGTGTITTATPMLSDPADGAASAVLETAWTTTKPTLLAGVGRRVSVPLAVGNGAIFDFTNRGLVVPVSTGLALYQVNASGATTGTIGGHFVWEE
jgi:hypothetical protein